jgi:hypothetical protein
VHIDICDEIVIIQCNDTEDLIATELVEMGIPRERIVLGFLPPEVQDDARAELPPYPGKVQTSYYEPLTHAAKAVPA